MWRAGGCLGPRRWSATQRRPCSSLGRQERWWWLDIRPSVDRSAVIAGSVSGVVTAVDIRDRRERWRYAHPRGGSVGLRITADAQSVYVPHLGGLLVALELRDGRPRWEVGGFDDGFSWAPALS